MKLYVVRHGETNHNKKGIYQGPYDVKLNRIGIKQAKLLAKRLNVINFDYIYSSDLLRAKKTTEEIMKYQNCPVKCLKVLRERNLGIFNNQLLEKYYTYLENNKLVGNIHHRLPGGGESYYAMQKRVINFMEKIYNKHKNQTVLFSTHGAVKKILLIYLNNISLENFSKRPKLENASLSIIKFHRKGKYVIELENDIKHLEL